MIVKSFSLVAMAMLALIATFAGPTAVARAADHGGSAVNALVGASPTVPDPKFAFVVRPGWGGLNVYFNKRETRSYANFLSRPSPQRYHDMLVRVCNDLPVGRDSCRGILEHHVGEMFSTFQTAARDGICAKLWLSNAVTTRWSRYNGTHCR